MNKEMFSLFNKSFSLSQTTETIKDLQSKLFSKKVKKPVENIMINKSQVNFLHVLSPFYDRNKVCNLKNCFCPYHKRLKQEIIKKKYESLYKNQHTTAAHSPSKGQPQHKLARCTHNPNSALNHNLQSIVETNEDYANSSGKLQSFNKQYEQFLKMGGQQFKKGHFDGHESHVVKTPVWKIFNYIYHHLDDAKEEVQKYIDSLQKDREIKCFYIQRFQDLKKRKHNMKKKAQKKKKLFQFNNTAGSTKKQFKPYHSFKNQFNNTHQSFNFDGKIHQKQKKTKKVSKLMILVIIQKLKDEEQIQQKHLLKFISLTDPQFLQNMGYLKRKISKMDEQLLQQTKCDFLQKAKQMLQIQLEDKQQNQNIINKIKMISEMILSIDEQIQKNQQEQEQQRDSMFSSTAQLLMAGKIQQKKEFSRNNSMRRSMPKQKLMNQLDLLGESNKFPAPKQQSPRQSQKQRNNTAQDDIDFIQAEELLLKENRIYSHGFFHRKKYLSHLYTDQQQNSSAMQKLNNLQDVQIYLKSLANESSANNHRMKDIQKSLTRYNFKKLLLKGGQDLITVKRKIRAINNLIQDQTVAADIKKQLKEYINLAQKQSLVKNYNWAYTKLKNIAAKGNQVQLHHDQEQNLKALMARILSNIFAQAKRLYFYKVDVTLYVEKECNFQEQFFLQITNLNRDTNIVHRDKIISLKRNPPEDKQKKKDEQQRAQRETDLIQVGLKNNAFSQYNYEDTINYRCFQFLHQKYGDLGKSKTRFLP